MWKQTTSTELPAGEIQRSNEIEESEAVADLSFLWQQCQDQQDMEGPEIVQPGDKSVNSMSSDNLMATQWKAILQSTGSSQTTAQPKVPQWALNEQREIYQAAQAALGSQKAFTAEQQNTSENVDLKSGTKWQMVKHRQQFNDGQPVQTGRLFKSLKQPPQQNEPAPTTHHPVVLQNSISRMRPAGTLSGKPVLQSFVEGTPAQAVVTTLSPDMDNKTEVLLPISKFRRLSVEKVDSEHFVGASSPDQRSFSADDMRAKQQTLGFQRSHVSAISDVQPTNSIKQSVSCPATIPLRPTAGPTAGQSRMQLPWEMDSDCTDSAFWSRSVGYENMRVHKANNQKLMAAMSQIKVIEVVEEIGTTNLGVINIAVAFNRLAKWRTRVPGTEQQLKKIITMLSSRCLELINDFYGRHIASIVHCFAKLHVRHNLLFNALIERGMQQHVQKTFNCQDVGNLSWAFASLGVRNVKFMNSLANWVVEQSMLGNFNNQELANTAWAYATLDCVHMPLMEGIAVAAINLKNVLNAQDIANISWAYAILGISSVDLLNALADAGSKAEVMETFTSQGIATVVWAYAKLGVLRAVFIDGLAERCLRPDVMKTFKYSAGLAKAAWGFAILRSGNQALMFALAGRIIVPEVFSKSSSKDIAMIMWAFAIQDILYPQLIDILADKALDILPSFTAQHIATTMWALAALKVHRTDLMDRMANHLLEPDVRNNLTLVDVSNVLWAYASLGIKKVPLVTMLEEQILQPNLLQQLDFESLADIVWSLAVVGTRNLNLMHQLGDHALALQSPPTLQVASNIIWAFKELGILRKDLMRHLCPLVNAKEDFRSASAKDLSTFVWALAVSGSPATGSMRLFMQRFGDPDVRDDLTSEDISNVAWAYATVGIADQWLFDQLTDRLLQPGILKDCTEDEASQIMWAYSVLGSANQGLMHALATAVVMT